MNSERDDAIENCSKVRRTDCDVVVIGATRAGWTAAEVAAREGARVTLIDHDPDVRRFETAWTLLRSNLVFLCRETGGRDASLESIRGPARDLFRRAMIDADTDWTARLRARPSTLAVISGCARFIGVTDLSVDDRLELSAYSIIIAAGSRPRLPAGFKDLGEGLMTPHELLARSIVPRSLAVIGADWSGCEWAFVAGCLGSSVQLLDRRTRLLRAIDPEIRMLVQSTLHRMGVEITLGDELIGLSRRAHGALHIQLASGRSEITEAALLLMGDCGNTAALDLAAAGVETDAMGHILIDDRGRSSTPTILAVGNVVDSSGMFASTYAQAERVALNALGAELSIDAEVPWFLSTHPPVSACGMSAESYSRLGVSVVLGAHQWTAATGDCSLLHLVAESSTSRLLGAQAAGAEACSLITMISDSITRGETIDDFIVQMNPADPLHTAVKRACLDVQDRLRTENSRRRALRLRRA